MNPKSDSFSRRNVLTAMAASGLATAGAHLLTATAEAQDQNGEVRPEQYSGRAISAAFPYQKQRRGAVRLSPRDRAALIKKTPRGRGEVDNN